MERSPLPIDHLSQLIERSEVKTFYLKVKSGKYRPKIILFNFYVEKEPLKKISVNYNSLLINYPRDNCPRRSFETLQESIQFLKSIDIIREHLV